MDRNIEHDSGQSSDSDVEREGSGPEQSDSESRPVRARELRRSKENQVIAGVCGGLGRYLGLDPVLFRIAFLISLLAGGIGLLIYIVFWIAVPEFESVEAEQRDTQLTQANRGNAGLLVGGGLILVGLVILMREIFPWFDTRVMGALVLIAIGAVVVIRGVQRG